MGVEERNILGAYRIREGTQERNPQSPDLLHRGDVEAQLKKYIYTRHHGFRASVVVLNPLAKIGVVEHRPLHWCDAELSLQHLKV